MLFFSFCTKIPTSLSVKRFEDLRRIVKDPFFFMHYRHLKRKHGINNNKKANNKKVCKFEFTAATYSLV